MPSARAGRSSSGAAGSEQPPRAISCNRFCLLPSPKIGSNFQVGHSWDRCLGQVTSAIPSSLNYSVSLFFRGQYWKSRQHGTELGSTGRWPSWTTSCFLGQPLGAWGRGECAHSTSGDWLSLVDNSSSGQLNSIDGLQEPLILQSWKNTL